MEKWGGKNMEVAVQASYKYKIEMDESEADLLINLLDRLPSSGITLSQDEVALIDRFIFSTRQAFPD